MRVDLSKLPNVELPHLGFQRFAPHPQLKMCIQCYWVVQAKALATASTETLYPDGGSSLNISFSPTQLPHISFSATHIAQQVQFLNSVDTLGIRFNPGGAFRLFNLDMREAMDDVNLQALNISGVGDLQEQLATANTTGSRLTILENWLLSFGSHQASSENFIANFLPRWLNAENPLNKFIQDQQLSRRQVERRFQLEVGVAPAYLKQLQRIKLARQLISQDLEKSLTDIAQDIGFYDQAHFIKHFQKVTGQTPGQYKQKKMSQKYNS